MRARHRHLNQRDAGAGLVFDARYITDVGNNDPLSTWSDRSRNAWNATQSGVARPTYLASDLNGNAAVSFSQQQMPVSSSANGYFQNKSNGSIFCIAKSTSVGGEANHWIFGFSLATGAAQPRIVVQTKRSTTQTFHFAGRRLDTEGLTIINSTIPSTNYSVLDCEADWANGLVYLAVNGSSFNTSFASNGSTSNTASQGGGFGGSTNIASRTNANIAFAIAFNEAITPALRKRLRHSAAYSFKLSCN
jgi:hypothetical protein